MIGVGRHDNEVDVRIHQTDTSGGFLAVDPGRHSDVDKCGFEGRSLSQRFFNSFDGLKPLSAKRNVGFIQGIGFGGRSDVREQTACQLVQGVFLRLFESGCQDMLVCVEHRTLIINHENLH